MKHFFRRGITSTQNVSFFCYHRGRESDGNMRRRTLTLVAIDRRNSKDEKMRSLCFS